MLNCNELDDLFQFKNLEANITNCLEVIQENKQIQLGYLKIIKLQ